LLERLCIGTIDVKAISPAGRSRDCSGGGGPGPRDGPRDGPGARGRGHIEHEQGEGRCRAAEVPMLDVLDVLGMSGRARLHVYTFAHVTRDAFATQTNLGTVGVLSEVVRVFSSLDGGSTKRMQNRGCAMVARNRFRLPFGGRFRLHRLQHCWRIGEPPA